jgi:Haem-NO-binding
MYGIVNKAIEEMISSGFGKDKWDAVRQRSGVLEDFFISNEPYDDAITYNLAQAASVELQIPLAQVLNAFGEYWVLHTGKEKYGSLMEAGGNSLLEFLTNLPVFHNRIMLMYPNLNPPEFKVSDKTANSINVHYYSSRVGLQEFVRGLLSGLAKLYKVDAKINYIVQKSPQSDHDIFNVSW